MADRRCGLGSCQMDAEAGVRPDDEREMATRASAIEVEAIRIREACRIPIRRRERHPHQVAFGDRDIADGARRSRVPIDDRCGRFEPE